MTGHKTAVVALGGNAITHPDHEDTIANQFANTRTALNGIVQLAHEGYNLVISHGNGPQVGNAILRVELARDRAPILPLGVCVADTEGGMGYMIEQSLRNRLRAENIDRPVVTIITQMVVDANDPSVNNPTKYIGQFYSEEQAERYSTSRGWHMKQDGDRGWRRVVPSPIPTRTVEADTIKSLVKNGTIVIACGGGGIPVYEDKDGYLEGFDAVIDKDLASAVVGREIGAEFLSILTSVDSVAINFGLDNQEELGQVTLSQIKKYQADGHFPAGTMGPKIDAAIRFLENGGEMVAITSFKNAGKAINGEAGTRIVAD